MRAGVSRRAFLRTTKGGRNQSPERTGWRVISAMRGSPLLVGFEWKPSA